MEKNFNIAEYGDVFLEEDPMLEDELEAFVPEDICLDSISMLISDIKNYDVLTSEEEKALAIKMSEGDREARQLLINHNIKLVIYIAKNYANVGLDFEDVVQQGIIGLMNAVDNFDYRYGFKLSTYAVPSIKRQILKMTRQPNNFYTIPENSLNFIYKKKLIKEEYKLKHGVDPDEEYIAKALQISVQRLRAIEVSEMQVFSLDMEMYNRDGDPITLKDTLKSKDPSPEDEYASKELKQIMQDCVLSIQNEKIKRVIIERFGLDGNDPKTLQEIADEMNLSRERIRQLEEKGLRYLRRPRMQEKFKDFLRD